jgi:D-proline reductase (dithiol) PrdB
VSHNNYDHTEAELDINCIFPIERFRELEVEGYIGELAPVSFTIMGRIFRRTVLQNEMAPVLLRRLKDERVDVFFLVPA